MELLTNYFVLGGLPLPSYNDVLDRSCLGARNWRLVWFEIALVEESPGGVVAGLDKVFIIARLARILPLSGILTLNRLMFGFQGIFLVITPWRRRAFQLLKVSDSTATGWATAVILTCLPRLLDQTSDTLRAKRMAALGISVSSFGNSLGCG
jgi:hypothetical protein